MPRGRMLSRSISTSRRIESMSEWAQLLFDRVVIHADDFGRLEADPAVVKAEAKPLSPRSFDDFAAAIAEGITVGAYVAYVDASGRVYLAIEKSDDHQRGLHKRTKSRYPDPAACQRLTAGEYLSACAALTAGALPPHEHSGEIRGNSAPEEKRREGEEEENPPVVPPQAGGDERAVVDSPKRTRKKTATHMTPEWQPSAEWIQRLEAECPAVDVLRVVPEFRDYWIGEGKPKADWDATFRNRVRQVDANIRAGQRRDIAAFGRSNRRATPAAPGSGKTPSRTASEYGNEDWRDVLARAQPGVPPVPGGTSGGSNGDLR